VIQTLFIMTVALASSNNSVLISSAGTPRVDTQRAFVREVERVGQDPVYWVRREASFALGALAKVVPDELIIGSLVSVYTRCAPHPYRCPRSFRCSNIYVPTLLGM